MTPFDRQAFRFTLTLSVRDYECDFQGIVNHAVYLHYLEHTRHEFAKTIGLDVIELARRHVNIVVVRAEIDYKASLRSGDTFVVALNVEPLSRVRIAFHQEIHRRETDSQQESEPQPRTTLILQARMIATAVNENGRPFLPPELERFR